MTTGCGHGHVYPNPDGSKARCGGPGLCSKCSTDQARKIAAEAKVVDLADRRPVVHWTVRISQDWQGWLSVVVEDISSDIESRKRAADAMRRAADLIESGFVKESE